ncbi:MAG: hypothetical protein ACXWXR_07660 [Candidatus Limnocylindrales bacterium]
MRSRSSLAIGITLLLAIALPASTTLARFTDVVAATGSVATDTLDAPTVLAAMGGSSVTLTWLPSVDAYSTGYAVYRSSTSGTGYALVASVTPGSASTTTDSPGTGTWYYVLRTTFQSWSSVSSNETSAIVSVAISTPYAPCSTTAADRSGAGDNNGYETTPTRACADDSLFAVDTNSGTGGSESCGTGSTPATTKDRHRFYGFALGLPPIVTSIDGIRLRADLKLDSISGTHNLCAQLSWNSGLSWTTMAIRAITVASQTTYTFGSTSDTWGRGWTTSQLTGTNFRVRIIDASTAAGRDFSLDYIAVSVTYTP